MTAFRVFRALLVGVLVVGCSSTATPVPTVAPTASQTPTPAVSNVHGILYWELNPDGARGMAAFSYPSFTESVDYYLLSFFPDLPKDPGRILQVLEPVLPGFEVCVSLAGSWHCSITDVEGRFAIEDIPSGSGAQISLSIADPNKDDPEKSMRYIFLDDLVLPVDDSVEINTDEDIAVGLAPGILTSPYSARLADASYVFSYTDLDLRMGSRQDWTGNSDLREPRNMDSHVWNSVTSGLFDQHQGTDWAMPVGTEIRSMFPGTVLNSEGGDPLDYARYVRTVVDVPNAPEVYLITYGHNSENRVRVGQRVGFDEVVALSGNDDGRQETEPHLHLGIWSVPRAIWNQYRGSPRLYDYIFGSGSFTGNGNAVPYPGGQTVAKDTCPFSNLLFTGGSIPIYSDLPVD